MKIKFGNCFVIQMISTIQLNRQSMTLKLPVSGEQIPLWPTLLKMFAPVMSCALSAKVS